MSVRIIFRFRDDLHGFRWWLKFMWAHAMFCAVTGRIDFLVFVLIATVPNTWDAWVKGRLPWKARPGRTPA